MSFDPRDYDGETLESDKRSRRIDRERECAHPIPHDHCDANPADTRECEGGCGKGSVSRMMTDHEHCARLRKSKALAEFLIRHGITSAQARLMTSAEWKTTAMCLSAESRETVHPPHSDETREMIYALMEQSAPPRYSVAEFQRLVAEGGVQ